MTEFSSNRQRTMRGILPRELREAMTGVSWQFISPTVVATRVPEWEAGRNVRENVPDLVLPRQCGILAHPTVEACRTGVGDCDGSVLASKPRLFALTSSTLRGLHG